MGKLFEELKRRKVFRVAAVYAVVAWLVIQVAGEILPTFNAPAWVNQTLILMLMLGFPITLVMAWAYEVTPEGVRADARAQSDQLIKQSAAVQPINYIILGIVLLVAGFQIADRFLAPAQQSNSDQSMSEITGTVNEAATLTLPENRFDIVTPDTEVPTDIALSPDGRQIVFVATDDNGVSQLWLRSLSTTTAQPLAETDRARQPFWSPDSRSIGFFTNSALKRLDLGGGAPQTLATTRASLGATWGPDNTLLFQSTPVGPLMRVSASGGEATAVTTLESGQNSHGYPNFLPDGQRFLFIALGTPEASGIYLGHLDGSPPVRLTASESSGVFHPNGWLMWVRSGMLTAQRLDLTQAILTGEPLTLADELAVDDFRRFNALSVARDGLIAYRTAVRQPKRQLTWIDRTGTVLDTLGDPDSTIANLRLSPDGRRLATDRNVEGNLDIWLLDGARNSRFTFDAAFDNTPVWSPDGSQIVFMSNRSGTFDLYQKPSNGAGEETLLLSSDQHKIPTSWSADGRFLLYFSVSPQTVTDLWALPMTGDRAPFVVLQTPFFEHAGDFSPDGRWVAYGSNQSGRNEIYVQPFVAPRDADSGAASAMSGLWQVSTAGGIAPTWSPDGKELYYLDPAGNMMAAPFAVTGDSVEVGSPLALFPTRIYGGGETDISSGKQYAVAADGRFLISTLVDEDATAPIRLIQYWNPEAAR